MTDPLRKTASLVDSRARGIGSDVPVSDSDAQHEALLSLSETEPFSALIDRACRASRQVPEEEVM